MLLIAMRPKSGHLVFEMHSRTDRYTDTHAHKHTHVHHNTSHVASMPEARKRNFASADGPRDALYQSKFCQL